MSKKLKAALYTAFIMLLIFMLFLVIFTYPFIASILLTGGGTIVLIGGIYNIIYMNLKD